MSFNNMSEVCRACTHLGWIYATVPHIPLSPVATRPRTKSTCNSGNKSLTFSQIMEDALYAALLASVLADPCQCQCQGERKKNIIQHTMRSGPRPTAMWGTAPGKSSWSWRYRFGFCSADVGMPNQGRHGRVISGVPHAKEDRAKKRIQHERNGIYSRT